jgi:hypothetical protein
VIFRAFDRGAMLLFERGEVKWGWGWGQEAGRLFSDALSFLRSFFVSGHW